MEKFNKLSLPAAILIASIALGGFFYASQVSKQKSIERQQEIKIEQEKIKDESAAFLLQSCLDEAKNNKNAPFDNLGYRSSPDTLRQYGIHHDQLIKTADSGFLGLPTIVKIGQQFGVKDLKQYLDSVATLRENLRNVTR